MNEKPKPRTKEVYEKVEGLSDKELAELFIRDELYCANLIGGKGSYILVDNCVVMASPIPLFRRVEKEIDWKDELKRFLRNDLDGHVLGSDGLVLDLPYFEVADNALVIDGALSHNDFIRMCHLVSSITDKPE